MIHCEKGTVRYRQGQAKWRCVPGYQALFSELFLSLEEFLWYVWPLKNQLNLLNILSQNFNEYFNRKYEYVDNISILIIIYS